MKPLIAGAIACALLGASAPLLASPPGPADVVDAFHKAMRGNKADALLKLMSPETVIFEQGFFEATRDDYARGHLRDDMTFAAATQREVLSREAITGGDSAWVLSRTRTRGSIGGRNVDLTGTETMLLRRSAEGWKITHIHWSAHSTQPEVSPAP